ncbi:hypothetical protein [Nocardioides sediminis]|uniref:hypothetical protein n=1 Tax=Nocardioides sediminis TaxID=433648 RepID=UPI00131EFF45|nr:hypothetical protein [Nocardioides sediminis]
MNQHVGTRTERVRAATEWVVPTAVALLLVQLAFRAWAAWSSWYSTDDLGFLRESDRGNQLSYLMERYNGHLMPGGKLVFWGIGAVDTAAWWPAVLYLVVGQAMASAACLWMLVTLFGRRRAILPPFVLYLCLPLSMPAFMWFVAATQQLPLQIVLSVSVATWVRYLRGEGRGWAVATAVALTGGMVFREKALLVVPILLFISLFYFTSGGVRARLAGLRRQGPGLLMIVVLSATYVFIYLDGARGQASPATLQVAADLAGTLLGSTLPTGLVGGPWRWDTSASQNSFADPPSWAVSAAWVALGLTVAYVVLRRRRAWYAVLLFAAYAAGTYLLVLTARGAEFGATLGVDTRYLSDIPIVLCLCLGLASTTLTGAPGSSELRDPAVVARAPAWLGVALLASVAIGSAYSSVGYVRPWHDNAARDFFAQFDREVHARGQVDLADRVLPEPVISRFFAPNNKLSFLAPLVDSGADFPDLSTSLHVVDDDGRLRQADIKVVLASRPGKVDGCGWQVTEAGKSIPLMGRAIEYDWWIRIGYLSTGPSTASIKVGDTTMDVSLRSGLNDLFLRVEDTFDSIRVDGLESGVSLCIDTVEVGGVRARDSA